MAATKKAPAQEPDLLAGLADDEPTTAPADESGLDLLDGISEDNGTPWMPWEEDDQPHGIQGTVRFVGTVPSDYSSDDCPMLEVEDAEGTLWSIRGYSTVLANQIKKTNPLVGDLFAVKYLGEKPAKKSGKDYHNFKAAVVHR